MLFYDESSTVRVTIKITLISILKTTKWLDKKVLIKTALIKLKSIAAVKRQQRIDEDLSIWPPCGYKRLKS